MENRTLVALALLLLIVLGLGAVLWRVSRDARRERRAQLRGERARVKARDKRRARDEAT